MSTKVIARVLLTLGLLAASIAYSSWTAQRTVLDPAATQGATHALLATPAVRSMLTRELHDSIAPALAQLTTAPPRVGPNGKPAKPLGPKARAARARAVHDAAVRLNAAIDAAVRDPKFTGAFEDAIMSLHEGMLSGDAGQVTLDSKAVTAAVNQAIARIDPKLAPKARQLQTVSVPLGGSELPHIGDLRQNARVVGNGAAAIAVLLGGGALLLVHDRKTFRRVGRRIALLAVPPVLMFLAVPRVLASRRTSTMSVSAAVLDAYGRRVLFSAAVLAVVGVSTWLIALALPRRWSEPDVPPEPGAPTPTLPDPRVRSHEPAHRPETAYL